MYKAEKSEGVITPSPADSCAINKMCAITIGEAIEFVDIVLVNWLDCFVYAGAVKYDQELQTVGICCPVIVLKAKLLACRYKVSCEGI